MDKVQCVVLRRREREKKTAVTVPRSRATEGRRLSRASKNKQGSMGVRMLHIHVNRVVWCDLEIVYWERLCGLKEGSGSLLTSLRCLCQ